MNFKEYLINESASLKPKKRPNKTLWYKDDTLWKSDIDHRMPARYIGDEENEEVFAVNPDDENQCYGVWRFKEKNGTTFAGPKNLRLIANPRAKFSDYKLP